MAPIFCFSKFLYNNVSIILLVDHVFVCYRCAVLSVESGAVHATSVLGREYPRAASVPVAAMERHGPGCSEGSATQGTLSAAWPLHSVPYHIYS